MQNLYKKVYFLAVRRAMLENETFMKEFMDAKGRFFDRERLLAYEAFLAKITDNDLFDIIMGAKSPKDLAHLYNNDLLYEVQSYSKAKSVILGFGGNMGEVPLTFTKAIAHLLMEHTIEGAICSSLYVNPSLLHGQADYTNMVCLVRSLLSPDILLERLKNAEKLFGRVDTGHWGARPLDIDIIDYNGEVLDTEALSLPHPRMHERLFVLLPLREVKPSYVHPAKKMSLTAMLSALNA